MLSADGCTAEHLKLSPENCVITAGSNQLLFLLGDILLDPGDIVLCGSPTYYVYLGILENLGPGRWECSAMRKGRSRRRSTMNSGVAKPPASCPGSRRFT